MTGRPRAYSYYETDVPDTGLVYCLHCLITHKNYVGQTKSSLQMRVNQHFNHNKGELNRDMREYGREAFIAYEICRAPYDELRLYEKYYIDVMNTMYDGYNDLFQTDRQHYKIEFRDGKSVVVSNLRKYARENGYFRGQLLRMLNGTTQYTADVVSVTHCDDDNQTYQISLPW